MSSIGTIAAQGLAFQATRLAVAASNIINARTSAEATADGRVLGAIYQPRMVVGVSNQEGGLRAEIRPVNPGSHIVFDAASSTGFSAVPNVDIASEMVTMMIASTSYRAAAQLIALDASLSNTLTDLLA